MKPERLEFFGVKSYVDKTVVQFDKLLQNGLFGIFGNTGSGKSTILDCIFLALYGKLPKTNGREDFINVKVGKCYVRFSFSIVIDGTRKIYEVYREMQLKGERKTPPQPIAKLYELSGDTKIPVEDNTSRVNDKLEEIIGLKIDDFEKCIVLPQGEFSAFVTLARADRLKMVSGLFNLNKYGDALQSKVNEKLKGYDDKLQYINGSLEYYKDVSVSVLDELDLKVKESRLLYLSENVKLSKIEEEFNNFKVNYERHNELANCKQQLTELENTRSKIEDYKVIIKKAEPSKTYVETAEELSDLTIEISKANAELESLNKLLGGIKKELSATQISLQSSTDKSDRITAITGELANLDLLSKDKTNDRRDKELEDLRIKYKIENEKFKDLNQKLAIETLKSEELSNTEKFKNIDKRISCEIDRLISAAQNSFLCEELQFLTDLKKDLTDTAKIDARITFLSKLKSDDRNALDSVKRLNELYSALDEFNKRSSSVNFEISELKVKIEKSNSDLKSIVERGNFIRQEVDKINEKIKAITNGEVLEVKISKLKKEKSDIETYLNNLKESEKRCLDKLNETNLRIASLTADVKNKTESYLKLSEKLKECAKNFSDLDQAKEIYSYYFQIAKLKEEVESFDVKHLSLTAKIKDLSEKIGKDDFSEEDYVLRKKNLDDLREKVDSLNINYNNLLKEYENLSQKFEKRCTIEKELSDLSKKRKVVSELNDAVKNKKFLAYIAEEYLVEIALDAKSILLELTGGRFGLIYQGDFFVEDFLYNDGGRRRVDAVSGGELFLVSLSLALSLSKYICAKSSRPMEFFFLDEGFGSLDKELIEVVVDCLYKLKNSSFSIGIISHVEALKERLPVRISVTGAKDGCGSNVNITA